MKMEDAVQCSIKDLKYVMEETRGTIKYGQLPSIIADEQQMPQLFQNLIGNALKFHGEEAPHSISLCQWMRKTSDESLQMAKW